MSVNYDKLRELQKMLQADYRREITVKMAMGEQHTRKIEILDLIHELQSGPGIETAQKLEKMLTDYGYAHHGVFE